MGVFKTIRQKTGKALIAPIMAAGGGHPAALEAGNAGNPSSKYQALTPEAPVHPADTMSVGSDNTMRYATEAVGTFFLLLVGMRVGTFTASLTYAALIFMAAGISKAHFNPAITAAHLVKGAITPLDASWYVFYQIVGATAGAVMSSAFFGSTVPAVAAGGVMDMGLTAVGLAGPTFILALIHVAMLAGMSRTEFFGLALGFALFAAVTAYGSSSNLFNPAIGLGGWASTGLLDGSFSFSALTAQIINLVVQAAAGALAALIFKVSHQHNLTGELLTEAIGTFVVVILIITTADSSATTRAQAVGLGYTALTFFGAEVSEAHYNPAVTLAHFLFGTTGTPGDGKEALYYVGTQTISALLAGLLGVWYTGLDTALLSVDVTDPTILLSLLFGATLLCLVHLHVLAAQENNGFFGLAIGFTLLADKVVLHTIYNPAAALGLYLGVGVFGSGFGSPLALALLVGVPLVGSGLAALLFTAMSSQYGNYVTEAVGVAAIVIMLISTASSDAGNDESFGGAASPTSATAVRRLGIWSTPTIAIPTESASGLDDGLLYAALAYMGQYISNAHFNPAITIAHLVDNIAKGNDVAKSTLIYLAVQTGTAIVIACACTFLYDVPDLQSSIDLKFGVGLALSTFLICLVHLNTAANANGYFGVAIGFAMFAAILSFGDSATALFNPAVAIGLAAASAISSGSIGGLIDLLLLVTLPLAGAALAGLVFQLMKQGYGDLVTEGVGTFLIILTLLVAPGSVGLVACAVTYMGGAISGAHFNPAISLTHFFRGDLAQNKLLAYVGVQVVGALLAGVVGVFEGASVLPSASGGSPLLILSAELLFSFLLCLIHLNVLSAQGVQSGKGGNGYFGLAMGFTLLAGFLSVGGVSGGVFNPAAAIGLYLANGVTGGGFALGSVLYYLIAPPLGARFATLAYNFQKGSALSA